MSLQEQVYDLFLLDQQVRGLESRLASAMRRVHAQKAKLDRLSHQDAELRAQIKRVKVKVATSEDTIQSGQERINKLREQMTQVKSNKEYSALLIEVNTLKVESGKVEDQALEEMGQTDLLENELSELAVKVAEQQKLAQLAQGEVDKCQTEVGHELNRLKIQRDDAAAQVPEDVRGRFNRRADAYEGQAMATVVEDNRRAMEYSCGGCYMSIPVEHVNSLMSYPNQVVECPSCGRILYMDRELKADLAK